MISDNQRARKLRSEAILRSEGVPFLDHLPVIEDERTAELRTSSEIALRAMVLNVVSVKGEGLGHERALEIVEQYHLESALTPDERQFLENDHPSDKDKVQFSWRYEAYWTLLWALNFVDELGRPDTVCDVELAVRIKVDRASTQFIDEARCRDVDEILDALDLTYRYDWACVDARLNGKAAPAGLNPGVVVERHHALNWLVGYGESAEWDDVTTDT